MLTGRERGEDVSTPPEKEKNRFRKKKKRGLLFTRKKKEEASGHAGRKRGGGDYPLTLPPKKKNLKETTRSNGNLRQRRVGKPHLPLAVDEKKRNSLDEK